MKPLLLFFILALLASCTTTQPNFSQEQKDLIYSGAENQPMRLFLIDNPSDSTLLRTKSEKVFNIPNDTVLHYFTKRLYATVIDDTNPGVGIAAPQVGILKRIIWVQRMDKDGFPFEAYFNPEITYYSEKKRPCPEGCLSIPGERATTLDRSFTIKIKYEDGHGMEKEETIEDFTSVIFQHEIDHLNGILFIDHLLQEENRATDAL